MIESNHTSVDQTYSYGYQSINDEAEHLGEITEAVLSSAWAIKENSDKRDGPKEIAERKYNMLVNQPFTRIIPGYGICCNSSCFPRYENCFSCKYFVPDEVYMEYFENAINLVEEKIATLQEKHGSKEAIDFNKNQLKIFKLFLHRFQEKQQKVV